MTSDPPSQFGITPEAEAALLGKIQSAASEPSAPSRRRPLGSAEGRSAIETMRRAAGQLGLDDPYFRVHEAATGATTRIGARVLTSFSSYNYLGLNTDTRVHEAAMGAMRAYGVSASASRLVAGERPVHKALEEALARIYHAEDCVSLVSGHATNVTVIGCLVGKGDVVIHDQLAHNSIVQGALLSGAERIAVAHNDLDALAGALARSARPAGRTLVVIEGHYSMDGDIPDLAAVVRLTREHAAWLMVDEAHSLGVLGKTGRGLAEERGVDPSEVDIWMGTLSKSLVGCGGYIAASRDIVDYLRCTAPGFVYSVGMPPPIAAASLKALELMLAEPARVQRLRANGQAFLAACRRHGLNTGESIGAAIVPVMVGSSIRAARAAQYLHADGVNVLPVVYPAVPERSARLRFFITSEHETEQLEDAAGKTAAAVALAEAEKLDYTDLVRALL